MSNRNRKIKKASIISILGNFFLFWLKGIIGFLTNSQAMIADAFNSLTDILSSFMSYIGNHIASIPSDDDHNLGHGKAEYIYSLFISFMMFILSIKIVANAISSFFNSQSFHFSYFLIITCLITIIVKLSLFFYNRRIALSYNSILMEASYKDHRNDVIITTFNLIAAILSIYHFYLFDSIVGLGIGLWIFLTALKIFKKSYDVLMDKSFSMETKNKVLAIIEKHPEIKKINHFNATPVGYQYQISFTIFVDGNLKTYESHEIANKIEKEIIKNIPEIYLAVIHINPL